jgi:Tfp pilus assembly protein PilZ/CheY-like chemotaxis protein
LNQPNGNLLAIGNFSSFIQSQIEKVSNKAALACAVVPSLDAAEMWLERRVPDVILVECKGGFDEKVFSHFDFGKNKTYVPMIGLIDTITDLKFEELLAWGGHDLVAYGDMQGLVPRLRALQKLPPSRINAEQYRGVAILADPKSDRSSMAAKVLQSVGYDVIRTTSSDEAKQLVATKTITLMVMDIGLEPDSGIDVVIEISDSGRLIPTIITAPPRVAASSRHRLETFRHVAWHDSFTPPHNLLFLANKLIDIQATSARAHPRLLYGSNVWFRRAGSALEHVGFSYNISEGGLFIRTLVPFEMGEELWLEMTPPRSDRRVRLEAIVVWNNPFGTLGKATAPPGIGACISDGTKQDFTRYRDGCRILAKELGLSNQVSD